MVWVSSHAHAKSSSLYIGALLERSWNMIKVKILITWILSSIAVQCCSLKEGFKEIPQKIFPILTTDLVTKAYSRIPEKLRKHNCRSSSQCQSYMDSSK